jgi:hypothetical protein
VTLPKTKSLGEKHQWVERTQFLDTCGAFNIISRRELHDIKPASHYGMSSMRLKSLESNTSWYRDVGKSCAKDEHGKTVVRCAYANDKGDPSKPPFYLIAMATLVDERIDLQHHMKHSLLKETKPLRRMPKVNPFEKPNRLNYLAVPATPNTCLLQQSHEVEATKKADIDESQCGLCSCQPRVVEHMSQDEHHNMVTDIHNTGCQESELDWDNYIRAVYPIYAPSEDLTDLGADSYRRYMTEMQLQAIVNQQGIQATGDSTLDMCTVGGKRVSRCD